MPWYRPLISCRLFEKVNAIRREIKRKKKVAYDAPLKGLLFDSTGSPLISYETINHYGNGYIYYRTQNHIANKLNLSQKRILKKLMNIWQDLISLMNIPRPWDSVKEGVSGWGWNQERKKNRSGRFRKDWRTKENYCWKTYFRRFGWWRISRTLPRISWTKETASRKASWDVRWYKKHEHPN